MKIGIISDTHIRKDFSKIDDFFEKHLKDVDGIVHAGDYVDEKLLNKLMEHKEFIGVYGNVDDRTIKEKLGEKEIIEVEGYKIGLFHGHGSKRTTLERVYDEFKVDDVDIIIFGHSHKPLIKTKNKVLMMNPGSPTSKRSERWFTYIILELEENVINAQLRFFS